MTKVFIPAGIKDKSIRDTFLAIVKEINSVGSNTTIAAQDPTSSTVGVPGQLIYAESSNSIWMFVADSWVKVLGSDGKDIFLAYATDYDSAGSGTVTGFSLTPTAATDWIGTFTGYAAPASNTDYSWVYVHGTTGDTIIHGKVFYGTLQAGTPSTPNATSWNLVTSTFVGLTTNWSQNQPPVNATNTSLKEWSSAFTVTINGSTNAQNIAFNTATGAIQIADDIESDNFTAGSAGWRLQRDTGSAEFGSAAIRGTLTASQIGVTSLSAISANMGTLTAGTISSTAGNMTLDLTAGTLIVRDASNNIRVKLGVI